MAIASANPGPSGVPRDDRDDSDENDEEQDS